MQYPLDYDFRLRRGDVGVEGERQPHTERVQWKRLRHPVPRHIVLGGKKERVNGVGNKCD
jgi:hypothetical protein